MNTRRAFLQAAGIGVMTPWVVSTAVRSMSAAEVDPATVFSLSVASGDPSTTGVILWTRIDPSAYAAAVPLRFEVANDEAFRRIVVRGEIAAANISATHDYTARVDLDGQLKPGRRYAYRFVYNGVTSRMGLCRTLPADNALLLRLRLAVLTCQDYTNGYYGAFAHLAKEDVDFVIHLGDYIYETSGDPAFQALPYPDRTFKLPSEASAASTLDDYRFLYRKYRSDPLFQLALEQQTFINLWDDHETANDCYWDYDRNTLGAPDHPFTVDDPNGGDPTLLRQLKLWSQQAWSEYIPARVTFDSNAADPFQALSIYRKFRFGRLVEFFATDERTYRDAPPCGLDHRLFTKGCPQQDAADQSMLGEKQKAWFVNGVTQSTATWKVWGNEVCLGQLKLGVDPNNLTFATIDGWDGYEGERKRILQTIRDAGVRNFVAVTGDLHSYMASYLKVDYLKRTNDPGSNIVGVEFMTPAVTSATLIQQLLLLLNPQQSRELGLSGTPAHQINLFEKIVETANPHIQFFNSQEWGYMIVEFTPFSCTASWYSVITSLNSADAPKRLIRQIRVPANSTTMEDLV